MERVKKLEDERWLKGYKRGVGSGSSYTERDRTFIGENLGR